MSTQTVVIKYGGHAMDKDELNAAFADDMAFLQQSMRLVVVHGGGPQINALLNRLAIESRFEKGLRVTDADTMQAVEMVLCGQVNKTVVSRFLQHGARAAGLSGRDAGLLRARVKDPVLGLFFGFLAALGWGIEGCVCGYGVSIIDSEVGITIREVTIGISNLIILVPILGWIGQTDGFAMLGKALADVDSMKWFVVAGFLCYFNFMCWYRGNAMCGAALGMACNGAYSFWGPFFCWLILGVVFGLDGWNMVPVAWVGAVLMVVGIFTIATNPLALFHRKEQ